MLQHLQAAHRPEHFVQPGYPLGGCAGSALSQPCPTESSRKGKKSSEVTLCSQGNFCTGASVVRLGQAEPWVNGPLLWTFQSFSKKTGHHEVGESVWDWSQEGKIQVLKQYLLENGVVFFSFHNWVPTSRESLCHALGGSPERRLKKWFILSVTQSAITSDFLGFNFNSCSLVCCWSHPNVWVAVRWHCLHLRWSWCGVWSGFLIAVILSLLCSNVH